MAAYDIEYLASSVQCKRKKLMREKHTGRVLQWDISDGGAPEPSPPRQDSSSRAEGSASVSIRQTACNGMLSNIFWSLFGQQNQVFQMVKGMQTSMELEYFQLFQDQHERWL